MGSEVYTPSIHILCTFAVETPYQHNCCSKNSVMYSFKSTDFVAATVLSEIQSSSSYMLIIVSLEIAHVNQNFEKFLNGISIIIKKLQEMPVFDKP